jgi:type IX secretion system PorP/SprF family membrane protein
MTTNRELNLKKGILTLFMLLYLIWNVSAQQDPMFTQYMYNPVTINPAYAGSSGTLNFTAMNRQQWVGIDGAPTTMTLSINSPFIGYNVGVGLSLIYDVIGPTKETGIFADYSYHLKMTSRIKLAFGLKGGVNIRETNLTNLIGSVNENNLALYSKLYLPNFGIGSYLYSDRFYLGLSIPEMLQNSLSDDPNNLQLQNKEERHYFFTGGFVIDAGENIRFKPSTTVRIVNGAPVNVELSADFILHDKVWLGAMYRNDGSIGGMVKFNITDQLSLGYSYDVTESALRYYSQGTHEIFISYDVAFRNKKILSPRFF